MLKFISFTDKNGSKIEEICERNICTKLLDGKPLGDKGRLT